jgi:hypothetical protein
MAINMSNECIKFKDRSNFDIISSVLINVFLKYLIEIFFRVKFSSRFLIYSVNDKEIAIEIIYFYMKFNAKTFRNL